MKQEMISGKNILVTGGAGFIGSHLVERLATDNHVIVLDNLLYGSEQNLLNVPHVFIKDDIRTADLHAVLSMHDIDLVFHLASYHLDDSLTDPMSDFTITALGGLRLLEACRKKQVERIIFSSTGSVYGQPAHTNHDESHPLAPTTPYGVSKTAMDNYCRIYADIYGLKTVRLRYYNIYGPRRTAGAIPQFILRALQGNDIHIQGGEQTRTPTYVSDNVEATYRAGWVKDIDGMTFNIAAAEYISILDMAKLIVRLCGTEDKVRFQFDDHRPGEIRHLRPNVELAKKLLGWEARVGLEEGLLKLIDYLKSTRINN
jgi:UDP-glucose 4-epimerase